MTNPASFTGRIRSNYSYCLINLEESDPLLDRRIQVGKSDTPFTMLQTGHVTVNLCENGDFPSPRLTSGPDLEATLTVSGDSFVMHS
jgi:hypothetical protein